ncbi:MAG: PorT family protein [Cyclobacteriaceae bacterium]|nr:PorT family protein [Cyclobacteriaceae bacterium]
MKKTILILLLIASSAVVAQAQTIIPKIGLSVSSTNGELETPGFSNSISSCTGFTIGLGYNYPLGTVGRGIFSVQPELSFIQKGFNGKTSGEINIGEAIYQLVADQQYKINYLELPVLAKIEFGSAKTKFSFLAGPSIGYGLGGKLKGKYTLDDGYDTWKENIDGKIKFGKEPSNAEEDFDVVYFDNRLDVGLNLGAGVTLYNKIAIDVRYQLSFTNLSDDADSANRVLQFTVGVPLSLK